MKPRFFWLGYFFAVWGGRALLLASLYFLASSTGMPFVDCWYYYLPHALVAEAGVVATFTFFFALIDSFVFKRNPRLLPIIGSIMAFVYLATSGGDDELMRWMGQHLSLSFLLTYTHASSDLSLVGRVFFGGLFHFCITALLIIASAGLASWIAIRFGKRSISTQKAGVIALCILLILCIGGLTSREWFAPSKMRWKRIQPVAWSFYDEWHYRFEYNGKPSDYAAGIAMLHGNVQAEYPFWHPVANEKELMNAFRNKPLEEKPDVILMTVESLRGWTADTRIGTSCKRFPNLCKLRQTGAFFPNTQSVSFPSIEGMLGIQLSMWSHPEKVLLSDRANIQTRSLPDILGDAGYYRVVLTASEPSFDNLTPWFAKWYDYSEYKPENDHDVPLANRFAELYAERPKDKPLYLNWMSSTMHVPFAMPENLGPNPDDMGKRYERTFAYTDSAIGIVLDVINKSPRAHNTIIIVTGDHSFPTKSQASLAETQGIHAGYTWVTLLFAGPGVPQMMQDREVSHVDIAPTLLPLLGIQASNHFVGQNLFALPQKNSTFSFRNNDLAFQDSAFRTHASLDDTTFVLQTKTFLEPTWDTTNIVDGFTSGKEQPKTEAAKAMATKIRAAAKAWRYVVDNNLIMPPVTKEN